MKKKRVVKVTLIGLLVFMLSHESKQYRNRYGGSIRRTCEAVKKTCHCEEGKARRGNPFPKMLPFFLPFG